jgi:hypothetical protein
LYLCTKTPPTIHIAMPSGKSADQEIAIKTTPQVNKAAQ